jgi:hypothetical protein
MIKFPNCVVITRVGNFYEVGVKSAIMWQSSDRNTSNSSTLTMPRNGLPCSISNSL